MNVDFDRIHAFYDATGSRLKNNYAMRAGVVDYFMQNQNIPNTTTLWGQCHGVGDPFGKNAMSLNYNHGVVAETDVELTPDYVKTIRLHSPYDMGISEEFANSQLFDIKAIIHAFGGSDIEVTSDRMGIVFVVPGFRPLDMAKADYVRLERSVGLCIHEGLRNEHKFMYGSEYNDTINLVDKAHREGINDNWWGEFNGIFQPQEFDKRHGFSEETYDKLMYLYKNEGIKKPFGWAYSLGFNNDGCVGAITWAIRNTKGIGANEGLGALSNRISEQRSDQENAELKKFYVPAVEAGLKYSGLL